MDGVDGREHALAFRLDASFDVDAAVEKRLLAVGGELFDVGDEHARLPLGDGTARLNGVDHEHELFEGEIASLDGIFHGVALVGFDVDVEVAQRLDIVVDAFAFCRYPIRSKPLDDLRHGKAVLGVGFLLKDFPEIENFELRLAVVRHNSRFLEGRNNDMHPHCSRWEEECPIVSVSDSKDRHIMSAR